jgi:diguanylate cyclase (GGDEF)-like protein
VYRDVTERKFMENELKRLAATDPLTGADNRRSFLEKAAYELLRSQRYEHAFALLMLDVDHFKSVNDTYGHKWGDQVLKAIVAKSLKTLRDTDLFGRIGGEEFAIILPESEAEAALEVGERLRQALSEISISSDKGSIKITVSIGLAMMEAGNDTLEAILERADAALYKAKQAGRNKLVRGEIGTDTISAAFQDQHLAHRT